MQDHVVPLDPGKPGHAEINYPRCVCWEHAGNVWEAGWGLSSPVAFKKCSYSPVQLLKRTTCCTQLAMRTEHASVCRFAPNTTALLLLHAWQVVLNR